MTTNQQHQELIILAGVVGSGKTALSSRWQEVLPGWTRVNQDDLGDRRTCENHVRNALRQGLSVVVDRQNFDVEQRRHFLEIASEFPNVKVGGMVMGTSLEDCRTRLTTRTAHPTIDNPQLAISLLEKFSGLWVEPTLGEGYDHLITLPFLPLPAEIDAALITSLLTTLHSSPSNPSALLQRRPRPRPQEQRADGFTDDGTWRPPPVPSVDGVALGESSLSSAEGAYGHGTGGRHASTTGPGFGGHTGMGGVAAAGGHSYRPHQQAPEQSGHVGQPKWQPSQPHVPYAATPIEQQIQREQNAKMGHPGAYGGVKGGYDARGEKQPPAQHNWGGGGNRLGGPE